MEDLFISPEASIRDAMERVNANALGIALVVDPERRLTATVTDGDIRRAILRGADLSLSVAELVDHAVPGPAGGPIVAPAGTTPEELLDVMRRYSVRHIPLLDDEQRVVGLARIEDLVQDRELVRAVVMAGGLGTRLRPLTEHIPKPLLPIGDRPLIEHILGQLRAGGVHHVSLSTHYKSDAFREHLGDGRRFGVEIDYLTEEAPLGTAGALALMPPWDSTLLVINGDILTRVNYRAMLDFHREHRASLTVGVRQYEVQVPFGVVDASGVNVRGISEKPVLRFFVNAGVYLLEPELHARLSAGRRVDMTELIEGLVAAGDRVVSFPISEYWLDIGQLEDYERAQADVASGRF
jgi:dTDP-glucose pyrophosphorylase/CBS domain-containing protein